MEVPELGSERTENTMDYIADEFSRAGPATAAQWKKSARSIWFSVCKSNRGRGQVSATESLGWAGAEREGSFHGRGSIFVLLQKTSRVWK